MTEPSSKPTLLAVGLDAACLPVLERVFDRAEVPTLRRLVEGGASGPLESQIPPWTASAWPSLYTGKNPGKHGVFDFISFDGYDWDVVNATHVRARPIWELLSDHGLASVVVNVPVTHPPRSFDGALIPGMTAPERPACHPQGLLEDVDDVCDGYNVYPRNSSAPAESTESYELTVDARGTAFRYLLERFEPDFGFLQFQVTDTVFHERPGDMEAVTAIYRAVDRELEATLEAADPDNVVLVSDHGMGEVPGHEFRANEFLRDRGCLEALRGEGMPDWSRTWRNDLLDGESADEASSPGAGETTGGDGTSDRDAGTSALERAVAVAARFGITTQRVARALDAVGLKETVGRFVPTEVQAAGDEAVDFPASRAYVRSKSELGVRINLEDREPNGQVPQSRYEEVRRELIEDLSAVRTPDGEPMFDAVEPRETYFEGPALDNGPDVVTVPAGFDNALEARLAGETFAEPREPWNHKRTGLLAAVGSDVDESASLEGAHLFDVAPTVCSLFDVPVDADMDGEALPVVDPSEERSYPAYEPDPITATDDQFVEDRLSDLGYL